jgi:predicted transcriptional regulator
MSKAVMISIRPKWCEKIASGEKTIEVRKTRPKLQTPFKCYIYCTVEMAGYDALWVLDAPTRGECSFMAVCAYLEDPKGANKGNSKVIGEFTCDAIARVNICGFWDDSGKQLDNRLKETCLTSEELCDYLGEKVGYGWHISDLKIYDKLKELSKFSRPFENCIDKVCDEFGCESCENGGHIKRPPQSWCYVEAMDNG